VISNTSDITATGDASLQSCYASWASWWSASIAYVYSTRDVYPTQTTVNIWTLTSTIYSTYTLCDGIPRAVVSPGGSSSTTTSLEIYPDGNGQNFTYTTVLFIVPSPIILSVITVLSTETDTFYDDYPPLPTTTTFLIPTPACTINPTDCAILQAASSDAMWTGGSYNVSASPIVLCGIEVNTPTGTCSIYIPSAQLI
jgi:hypothetical protein